ncbi:MAG: M48 family metalloprotease [Pseudomonadota bacterium]
MAELKKRFIYPSMLLAVVGLAGCSSSSNPTDVLKSGVTNVSGLVSSVTEPKFEEITTKRFAPRMAYARQPAQTSLESSSISTIAVRNEPMERYMRSVTDRLLAHWDGYRPKRIGLFLSAENEFNAKATSRDDILFSIHAMNTLKTEDQFAALLAHELAHVLYQHLRDEKGVREAIYVAQMAGAGFVMAKAASRMERRRVGSKVEFYTTEAGKKKNGADAVNAVAAVIGASVVLSDIGLSMYNRRQEFIADAFAVELLHRAGYDPSAMLDILEYIERSYTERQKRKKALKLHVSSLSGAVVQVGMYALGELARKVSDNHPAPARRLKAVRTKLRKTVGDAATPDQRVGGLRKAKRTPSYRALSNFYRDLYRALPTGAPTEKSRARLKRLLNTRYGRTALARTIAFSHLMAGGPKSALRALETATQQNSAPLQYFAARANAEAVVQKPKAARRTIKRMASRYGWKTTYPVAIKAAVTLKDDKWANALLANCLKVNIQSVVSDCKTARKGAEADGEFRVAKVFGGLASVGLGSTGVSQSKGFATSASGQTPKAATLIPQGGPLGTLGVLLAGQTARQNQTATNGTSAINNGTTAVSNAANQVNATQNAVAGIIAGAITSAIGQ